MKNNIIITILLLTIVSSGAFFAGTKYQQNKQQSNFRQLANGSANGVRNNANNQGQQFRGRQNTNQANGDIISQDDKSITVKLQDGSSKIVIISETTSINKASQGSKEDLKVGEKVAAFGTANADGSLTAQNIQLNPILRNMPQGGVPTQ